MPSWFTQLISFMKSYVFSVTTLTKSVLASVTFFFTRCLKILKRKPILWIPILISGAYSATFLLWSWKVGFKLAWLIVKRKFWMYMIHGLRLIQEYLHIAVILSFGLFYYIIKQGYCTAVHDFFNSHFCKTVSIIKAVDLPQSSNLSASTSQPPSSSTFANSPPLFINRYLVTFILKSNFLKICLIIMES